MKASDCGTVISSEVENQAAGEPRDRRLSDLKRKGRRAAASGQRSAPTLPILARRAALPDIRASGGTRPSESPN